LHPKEEEEEEKKDIDFFKLYIVSNFLKQWGAMPGHGLGGRPLPSLSVPLSQKKKEGKRKISLRPFPCTSCMHFIINFCSYGSDYLEFWSHCRPSEKHLNTFETKR
jgi:hypothetical protein